VDGWNKSVVRAAALIFSEYRYFSKLVIMFPQEKRDLGKSRKCDVGEVVTNSKDRRQDQSIVRWSLRSYQQPPRTFLYFFLLVGQCHQIAEGQVINSGQDLYGASFDLIVPIKPDTCVNPLDTR
jgi:hypothetical protein